MRRGTVFAISSLLLCAAAAGLTSSGTLLALSQHMKRKAAAQFVRRLPREDSLLAKTFGVRSSFGEGGSLITALYALLVAVLVCLPSTSRAQLVDSFDPNANNDVRVLAVQADGKILVGGVFTSMGGQTRNRIALLNPDGSLDASFDPNANQGVFAVPVQADGEILVGGYFTSIGGQTRNNIARLNPDEIGRASCRDRGWRVRCRSRWSP